MYNFLSEEELFLGVSIKFGIISQIIHAVSCWKKYKFPSDLLTIPIVIAQNESKKTCTCTYLKKN